MKRRKSTISKLVALCLAAVMTLSFVAVYHNTVEAEYEDVQMEGTSKEVLDELRIPSTQVSLGDEGENPYSENSDTAINMFPRMELMMHDNGFGLFYKQCWSGYRF